MDREIYPLLLIGIRRLCEVPSAGFDGIEVTIVNIQPYQVVIDSAYLSTFWEEFVGHSCKGRSVVVS